MTGNEAPRLMAATIRRGKGRIKQKERTLILQKVQEIRRAAEEIKTFSRMESTPRTAEELVKLSRRSHIRRLGEKLGTLYGCLEASSSLEIGWLAEALQTDPLPLIDCLNTMGTSQGFRVIRHGGWLSLVSLEVIDHG